MSSSNILGSLNRLIGVGVDVSTIPRSVFGTGQTSVMEHLFENR